MESRCFYLDPKLLRVACKTDLQHIVDNDAPPVSNTLRVRLHHPLYLRN